MPVDGGVMAKKVVLAFEGNYHKYMVIKYVGPLDGVTFYVVRDDGKSWGFYDSLERAAHVAKEKAGRGAYESAG
jgi:hypothetical protein